VDYLIIYDDEPIGRMVEPGADPPMGVVQGSFVPFTAYKRVRAVFRLFTETKLAGFEHDTADTLVRFYQELDALHLSVATADGRPIPVTLVYVEDYSEELGDDGYEGIFFVPPNPLFEPSGIFFEDARFWDGPRYWSEEHPS